MDGEIVSGCVAVFIEVAWQSSHHGDPLSLGDFGRCYPDGLSERDLLQGFVCVSSKFCLRSAAAVVPCWDECELNVVWSVV